MKSRITIALLCTTLQIITAQSSDTDLKKVEILNSTSLALLDESAAIITSNPNVKEFNINTESLQSISFDGNLFSSNLQGLEYYGLGKTTEDFAPFTMRKIHMPAVSGAYSSNDSLSKVAIGIKFNVFTLYNSTQKKMTDNYNLMVKDISEFDDAVMQQVAKEGYIIGTDEFNNRFATLMQELSQKQKKSPEEFADLLRAPLLTLDVASAYSVIIPAKNFNDSQSGRFGIWSTLALTLGRGGTDLKLFGFCRYLQDNSDYNSESKEFTNHIEYFDYGSKAQLDLDKFALAYEYIKRNGDGKNYRSVGFIQYKVSDNLYITGGFGKNFESSLNDEAVTLLGVRWGINTKDTRSWEAEP